LQYRFHCACIPGKSGYSVIQMVKYHWTN